MRRLPGFAIAFLTTLAVLGAGRARAIGYLVPSRAEVEPLAIRYHRVSVTVRERMAETRVEQTFRNHTGEVLEATYVFPVPEGATVSGFAMWINGRRQEGELLDSARARHVYEQIVARMQDPGLVEHMGGNLFRARVFPIQPHSEQRVEIRFTQTLEYQGSVVHYRYPLRTGERAARTLEDFTFSAEIASRTAIRAVYSPTHTVSVGRADEHHATVGFEATREQLDQDFDLYYAVQDGDVGLSLLTHRPAGEDGYFLAMVAPRSEITEREIAAKEVLFVFDTSGSMAGDKLRRAQAALDYMLERLNPADRFQVVRFSTDVEALFDGGASVPASSGNVARARRFAAHFVAAGGTAIHGALRESLVSRRANGMPRLVVFLTDGMPTVGETDLPRITADASAWSRGARVYVFGVGDDVNTTFLDGIAERTGGVGDYFRDGAEMERRLSAFYDRVAYPLFTDLSLAFPGLNVYDVYPRDLGHLYRGGQLLVVGRYRGRGESRLSLRGRVAGEAEARSFAYPVSFPSVEGRNDFLPRIWATRKIGYLLDAIRLNGERPELRQEVVALARELGIVTPYTSYLVVEDEALPPGLVSPTVAPARTGAPRTETTYDFEDDLVDGAMARPDGELLQARRRGHRAPMMQVVPRSVPVDRATAGAEEAAAFEGFDATTVAPSPGASSRVNAGAPRSPPAAPSGATGEQGRRISRNLRSMREAERAQATGTQRASGRTFRLVRGMWVDADYRRAMLTLRVRSTSAGWLALLRARPELRGALALGARVAIALDADRAILVSPDAPAEVSEAQVTAFLGR